MAAVANDERLRSVENDINELKDYIKLHDKQINILITNQKELEIYIKHIYEKIDDLKDTITEKDKEGKQNKTWQSIIFKLIDAIVIIVGVVTGMKILKG